jgi:molybdate transport system substrate-binding protein
LTTAFTQYGTQFSAANVKFSFAGAAELAMQIQKGARPDLFASSNTSLPDMLHAEGLVSKPVVVATDRLVIAVPAGSTTVRTLADLAKPGVTIVIGSASTPVGADALTVLSHLPAAERSAILANVRFTGQGGSAVVAEVIAKGVNAGFLLGDDVAASAGKLTAIQLPNNVEPQVAAFGVAVVKGSKHPGQAQAFINGLLSGPGQQDLLNAGFVAPSAP